MPDGNLAELAGKAKAAAAAGNWSEVVALMDQLLALQPNQASLWYNKGLALTKQGRNDLAEQAMRRAVELQRSHEAAAALLSRLTVRQPAPPAPTVAPRAVQPQAGGGAEAGRPPTPVSGAGREAEGESAADQDALREWLRALIPRRMAATRGDTTYCAPGIPADRVAASTWAKLAPGEVVLWFFEEKLFGFPTDSGVMLTDMAMHWKAPNGGIRVGYQDLEEVSTDRGKLHVSANGQRHRLGDKAVTLLEKSAAVALAETLTEIRTRLVGEGAASPAAAQAAPAASVSEEIARLLTPYGGGPLFVKPNIPEKKLRNAIGAYTRLESGESIVALFDDTVFGSTKGGFCLTDRRLLWKGQGTGKVLTYPELLSV